MLSDFERHFFAPILRFPNSTLLGSDLMFEVPDAFLHIEVLIAVHFQF
jgi:hypothetical protein